MIMLCCRQHCRVCVCGVCVGGGGGGGRVGGCAGGGGGGGGWHLVTKKVMVGLSAAGSIWSISDIIFVMQGRGLCSRQLSCVLPGLHPGLTSNLGNAQWQVLPPISG